MAASATIGALTTALAALVLAAVLRGASSAPRRTGSRTGSGRSLSPRRSSTDYAAVLDAIARRVRTGFSLTAAVVEGVEAPSPLGDVADRLRNGGSLAAALTGVVPDHPDLALTVQALSAAAHLGGPVAATLDEAAAVLRERGAARAERRAHAAQARLSGRVLTIVPLGFAVWSAVASRQTRDVYVTTVAGGICAAVGLAVNLCGWQWMKRIIGPA